MLVIHYRFLLPTFSLSFSVPLVHFLRSQKVKIIFETAKERNYSISQNIAQLMLFRR